LKKLFLILFIVFLAAPVIAAETVPEGLVRGRITDAATGEPLAGATVFARQLRIGASADPRGYYNIALPSGSHVLEISFVGYQTRFISIDIRTQYNIDIALEREDQLLKEVVIQDQRPGQHVERTEMGVVRLPSQTIRQVPAFMGEVDILKVIQTLPGVQSAGEGASGFNVRGGGIDQNLILMDEAPVYNASHLMGFFSVFNNDVLKDISLFKGNIPAEYGGRLSSLLDVRVKEGDLQRFGGSGGIGSISSRLMLEGPIVKDRVSFIAAGRRSYADIFIPLANNPDIIDNRLFFYDLNMKVFARINERNRLNITTYNGRDVFRFGERTPFTMGCGNTTFALSWNNILHPNWLLDASLVYGGYDYSLRQEGGSTSFLWEAGNNDIGLKTGLSWFPNENNSVKMGFSSFFHRFNPGIFKGLDEDSPFGEIGAEGSGALQHGIFISNEQKMGERWSAEYGLRFSAFQSIGPTTVYNFDDNFNYVDSTVYRRGEIYNTWSGLEPRLGLRFSLSGNASLKASYNRNMQYLHLASYSDGGNPLDIWVPSSKMIRPQIANQFAVGYFQNIRLNERIVESSVEVFYKDMQNQIDFKDNAWLMLNPKIEGEFRFGRGRAYGAEFLLRKLEGRLTGWISYTLSRTERQIESINDGRPYVSSFDRTHNLNLVASYQLSQRVSLSATWVYTTGAPVTLPSGRFEYGNQIVPVYTERNAYRLPDYHRLDVGATLRGKQRPERRFHGEWNLSVYNAYYRKNTWMIDFRTDNNDPGRVDAYKVYLFPIIPAVTYNFFF
jgi:hypothetical protein